MVTEIRLLTHTYSSVNTKKKQGIEKTISKGKKQQAIPPSAENTTEKSTCREIKTKGSHATIACRKTLITTRVMAVNDRLEYELEVYTSYYNLGQKGLRIIKTGVTLHTTPSISHPSSHHLPATTNVDKPRFDTLCFV